jgi:RNA polymerase sigma factor (TIGR02999 family)
MPHQPEREASRDADSSNQALQERRALDDIFSLVYEELRRLASHIRRGDASVTLNSTALVHEAWLKLKDSPHLADTSVAHFKAIAAKAMRHVLVDAARRRSAQKRSAGETFPIAPQSPLAEVAACDVETLALDAALERLALLNKRQVQVVECRFFGGLNVAETATLLQISESVVERDWRAAKAWLASTIHPDKE